MRRRSRVAAALVPVLWAAAVFAGEGVARDWKRFPAVAVREAPRTIYAVGDAHGDYEKLVAVLRAAKLLRESPGKPGEAAWAGGDATLVCTGDMVDKGPRSLDVVRLMRALQGSAKERGGEVIVTLGNHEAEFVASGGAGKKGQKFAEELGKAGLEAKAVAAGKDAEGIGAWLRGLPAGAKVGDWFFCHAGNTGGMTLAKLESEVEAGVSKDGFGATVLSEPNSILEARTFPMPWWVAEAVASGEKEGSGEAGLRILKRNAEALGCRHVVMGHQPGRVKFGGDVERKPGEPYAYAGVLFLIDTGMSVGAADGKAVVLKIETGKKERAETIDARGDVQALWEAK